MLRAVFLILLKQLLALRPRQWALHIELQLPRRILTMIISKLFLPAVGCLTFLGAQHLLTVGRPEGLAAYLADLLTEGVLSLFGKAGGQTAR